MQSAKKKAGVLAATIASMFVWVACETDSTSSGTTFDAGPPGIVDSAVPDAFVADAAVPDASLPTLDADAADASPVTTVPFATGLGADGMPLVDGQIDPHWTVKDALENALTAYVQTDALGYTGYWLAPSATSKFISPFADTVDPTGSGTFTYTTTFVLGDEVDLSKTQLTIRYASDNAMTNIALNGASVGAVAGGGYSAFETLTVTTGFARGANSVSFVVANSGGPTGMRAELDLGVQN